MGSAVLGSEGDDAREPNEANELHKIESEPKRRDGIGVNERDMHRGLHDACTHNRHAQCVDQRAGRLTYRESEHDRAEDRKVFDAVGVSASGALVPVLAAAGVGRKITNGYAAAEDATPTVETHREEQQ